MLSHVSTAAGLRAAYCHELSEWDQDFGKSPTGNRCVRVEKHSVPACFGAPVNADEGSLCVQDWETTATEGPSPAFRGHSHH